MLAGLAVGDIIYLSFAVFGLAIIAASFSSLVHRDPLGIHRLPSVYRLAVLDGRAAGAGCAAGRQPERVARRHAVRSGDHARQSEDHCVLPCPVAPGTGSGGGECGGLGGHPDTGDDRGVTRGRERVHPGSPGCSASTLERTRAEAPVSRRGRGDGRSCRFDDLAGISESVGIGRKPRDGRVTRPYGPAPSTRSVVHGASGWRRPARGCLRRHRRLSIPRLPL